MAVHLFVPTFRIEECLSEIRECLEKGWTGLGFKTEQFEGAWCDYTGLPHAHFLNSATAGLHLATHILKRKHGWNDGDEVITTPLTFVSTGHAIKYERLQPVFADVDASLCLDPESVRQCITEKTRAVVFVGVGGNVGQYDQIAEICRMKGLALILDAAHMAGTFYNGATPGGDADVIVYSFQAVKNLPTADSGMVCFRDAADDALARQLAWLGIDKDTFKRTAQTGAYKWRYNVDNVGFKYHGNSIMAAIALVQLRYLDADNAYRRELAGAYSDALAGAPQIDLIPVTPGCLSSRHLYQIMVDKREEMIMALNASEIYPGVHYHDNSDYRAYAGDRAKCPRATAYSRRLLSLPLHLRMTRRDVQRISDLVVKLAVAAQNDVAPELSSV